jgi:hypothetical protein
VAKIIAAAGGNGTSGVVQATVLVVWGEPAPATWQGHPGPRSLVNARKFEVPVVAECGLSKVVGPAYGWTTKGQCVDCPARHRLGI